MTIWETKRALHVFPMDALLKRFTWCRTSTCRIPQSSCGDPWGSHNWRKGQHCLTAGTVLIKSLLPHGSHLWNRPLAFLSFRMSHYRAPLLVVRLPKLAEWWVMVTGSHGEQGECLAGIFVKGFWRLHDIFVVPKEVDELGTLPGYLRAWDRKSVV